MYESTEKDIWRVFREHHYLTADFNKGCRVFLLYWNDTLIGFNSVLNLPNGSYKYAFRTHRLVILPDYQNLGCGTKFEEFIGDYFLKQSCRLFLRTSHLRLGEHCSNSILWETTATNNKVVRNKKETNTLSQHNKYKNIDYDRVSYSFEYVGKDYNTKEHQNIICMGNCEKEKAIQYLEYILDKNKFPIIITGVAKQSKETNTIWEEVAKEYGYRIEILYISNKISKKVCSQPFDLICLDKKSVEEIKPYANNINKCIAWNEEEQGFYIQG